MTHPVMQTIDLTGASYSAALLGMVATTVLLLIGSAWVRGGWKLPVTLCGLATLVGVLALYESKAVWLSSSQVPLVYHYVGWIISMPLQVIALFFFARQMGPVSSALFWRLLVVTVLMVLFRYLGEAGFVHATLAFLIGIVFWLYILGEIFFGQMEEAVTKSLNAPVQRGYFWLRLIVTVGWAVYPLANFIISFSGHVDTGGMSVAYNLTEFLNRITFGIIILSTAVLASKGSSDE
ncbi:MAG: bacteriorhodopsin [Hyphomicrobiales bacterium]